MDAGVRRARSAEPTDHKYGWREMLAASALEGADFGLVRAAIDRGGARSYEKLTGTWPGDWSLPSVTIG